MLEFCKQILRETNKYSKFSKVMTNRLIYLNRTVSKLFLAAHCKAWFKEFLMDCLTIILGIILRIMHGFWIIMQINYRKFSIE